VILCLCRAVSDQTVAAVIAAGADSLDQVERACGAGADCGVCAELLQALVERARAKPRREVVPA
jgi:bacterioferritin-associated ferredoxin